jgi:hypothetical protein
MLLPNRIDAIRRRSTLARDPRMAKKKKARQAGHLLGFDPAEVPIVEGVAQVRIRYTHLVRDPDIRRVKQALRARGARSAVVYSGPVEKEALAQLLRRLEARGRPFHGGRVRFVGVRGGYAYFELRYDTLE